MTDREPAPQPDVLQWLTEVRRLDPALLAEMGVRPTDHPSLGRVAVFPYRRAGEDRSYAAKFRTVDKRFGSSAGVSRGLYGAQNLALSETLPIVITEGEIDALSVMQAGFDRAVSVPDGWSENGDKAKSLADAEADLRRSPFVVVAGDADAAGAGLPRAVANLLAGHDVRAVSWPDGCKDANDVLVKLGEGELARCINEARRIDPPGGLITGFSDLPPLSHRRVLRIGQKPFDWAVALELGALSVWTGTPGSGKSTFLVWAADQITRRERIRCGLLAFETHPHDIRDQLALGAHGQEFALLAPEWQARLLDSLDARFRLVHAQVDGDIQQTMGWLEAQVRTLALRDGCKLIIVDPWNELEHLPNPGESLTSYANWAVKTLRQWAEKLDVHIALVAHPRKMPTDGKPRAPTGYDVADSAAFVNKPSLGVTVHQRIEKQDDGTVEKWVELHTWKVRKTRLYGFEKGVQDVLFDKATMGYRERPRKDKPQMENA